MTLQQRKLKKILVKKLRNERKVKLYLLNVHWLRIRKQKERRKRRTLTKLWKMQRIHLMNNKLLSVKTN